MRRAAFVFVAVLALGCGGCAVLDYLAGVVGGKKTEKPFVTQVGETIANHIVPGSGALIAGALAAYADSRRRTWKKANIANTKAIDRAKKAAGEDGKIGVNTLTDNLAQEQDKAGVRTLLQGVISKVEAGKL